MCYGLLECFLLHGIFVLTNASGSVEEIARIDSLWLADAWCKDEAHFLVFALHVFVTDCW